MHAARRVFPIFLLLIPRLCLAAQQSAAEHPAFINVKAYGALGDGKANDTRAINDAIEAASSSGGGTVLFPAGEYLSGSIHLKSNVSLFIGPGATLVAAPVSKENGYDDEEGGSQNRFQDSGHSHWHNSFIWGDSLHDVSIMGGGAIWGKGLYKDWVEGKQTANKSIAILCSRNITIRDVTIVHGGWFAILATGVDNLFIDNIKIDTNRDGIDIDCCVNVRVSNCQVNSPFDDGICLKSSFALDRPRATENVTITNCQLSGFEEGTMLDGTLKRTENPEKNARPTGRIKFGTESNGGFKNVAISNCVFDYCCGIAMESVDGGLLEDVSVTNITMRDIVSDPIFLRLGARMRGPEGTPVGAIRRVLISNIIVYNADPDHCCTICGIPGHPIDDISLNNIRLCFRGGGSGPKPLSEIPEREKDYPEPGMFGTPPVYGFFIRHAKNIRMTGVEISTLSEDGRPPIALDDVDGVSLWRVNAEAKEGVPFCKLGRVGELRISQRNAREDQYIKSVREGSVK